MGRDVQRKLGPDDRVIGALVFDKEHGVSAPATTLCAAAGMLFKAADEAGEMFHKDEAFAEEIYPRGADHVLREICGLDPSSRLYADITQAHASVVDAIASNRSILDLI